MNLTLATKAFLLSALCAAGIAPPGFAPAAFAVPRGQQTPEAATPSRRIGAIKAIAASEITLAPDSGPEVKLTLQPSTRIVRIAPGEKDLKNATPIQLQDLQVGDRILVAGKALGDNVSILASSVVVMKRSDVEARHQQDLQDWQKRGVDGLATAVDAAAGTVTISARRKNVVIRTSGSTVIRRYAPDSVKFDDATPGTVQQIHPGDQVRARGVRSADGAELAAEEIVSGTFPNFAGTINAIDADASTLGIHDLSSKKNVTIRITSDSQLHRLSPEMAQRFAMRLKGAAAGASAASAGSAPTSSTAGAPSRGMGGSGGNVDLQQILNRTPPVTLSDLHKGDAVVILSTEGNAAGVGTAIELVAGVEPILQAVPNAGQAMMLAPWSLGGAPSDPGSQ